MYDSHSKSEKGDKPDAAPDGSYGQALSPVQAQRTPAYALGQEAAPAMSLFGGALQAKLSVSQPDDPAENEADAVAQRVMDSASDYSHDSAHSHAEATHSGGAESLAQRQPEEEKEEDVEAAPPEGAGEELKLQRKCDKCGDQPVMRKCADCEREELQRKSEAGGGGSTSAPVEAASEVSSMRGGGRPLSPALRGFYESRFGHDFGRVRIHDDSRAARTARSLGARAYTVGPDVAFAAGEYAPSTREGGRLLAHELTHVVQQRQAPAHGGADGGSGEGAGDSGNASGHNGSAAGQSGGDAGEGISRASEGFALSRAATEGSVPAGLIQRNGEGDAPAAVAPTPAAVSTAPSTAAMSAAMTGLFFQPPAGTTFVAGSRVRQGLAIMLRRLVGEQYFTGLEENVQAFLQARGTFEPQGTLVGEAVGGEEVGRMYLATPVALAVIAWLEEQGMTVSISEQQRDLLRYGIFSSAAWADINAPDVADEIGEALPPWYSEALFREEMSHNMALLREYIDAAERFRVSQENRAEIIDILRRIVQQLNLGANVLEAIRADEALAAHPAYQGLWPTPREAAPAAAPQGEGGTPTTPPAPPPPPAPAPPDRAPALGPAALFVSFIATQRALAERALEEHEARQEVLDRFGRFMGRVSAATSGDQLVTDRPGSANTPPIPARLASYPALAPPLFDAALETDHVFTMQLQYANVFEAFARYAYLWEYVRVPDEQTGTPVDVDQLEGQTQGWGDVAASRYARAGRYNSEDINRVISTLGPAGVNALSLVEANNILRYVGTTIRLGLEIITTPASEKHLVFPGEGMYVVRCKAVPITGDEAELVRLPSVAYLPVIARPPEAMAESRTAQDVTARERQLRRVIELQVMLSEPVSYSNQTELEEELRQLTLALGPLEDILEEQARMLRARRDALPEGSSERRTVERQLSSIVDIIGVRNARAGEHNMAGAETLAANFVSDEGPVTRLTMQAVPEGQVGSQVQFWVSDLTTPNSSQATGLGANKTEAVLAAVREILEGIHGYGRGYASVNVEGQTHTVRIAASAGSILMEAVENVSTAISVAAVVAAPFTGGGSLALLIPVGVVGAIPSAYRLISRAADDTLRLDMATAMDVVNIVGSFAGIAGEAAAGMRMLRVGQGFMIAGMGADGLGMLLMGAQIIEQLEALNDPNMPPGVRAARVMEIMGQAMMQVGIMVGSALYQRGRAEEMGEGARARDEGGGGSGRGRREGGPEAFNEWFESINAETRALLDANPELRRRFAEMDPTTRLVLTRCRSTCIPPGASAIDVRRIENLLARFDLTPTHADAVDMLRDYFHDRADQLGRAIDDLEFAESIPDLQSRLTLASVRQRLVPPHATAGVVARVEQLIMSMTGLTPGDTLMLQEFFNIRSTALEAASLSLEGTANVRELRARMQRASAERARSSVTVPRRPGEHPNNPGQMLPGQYDNPSGNPYKHSRDGHGAQVSADTLLATAAREGTEQGQWYANDLMVEALRRADATTYVGTNQGKLIYEFDMGRPIGRIITPQGAVAETSRVRVVRFPDGSLRTTFPIR